MNHKALSRLVLLKPQSDHRIFFFILLFIYVDQLTHLRTIINPWFLHFLGSTYFIKSTCAIHFNLINFRSVHGDSPFTAIAVGDIDRIAGSIPSLSVSLLP